jgi:hypothetical protein
MPFVVATTLLLGSLLTRWAQGRRAIRSGPWDTESIVRALVATDPLGVSADSETAEVYRPIALQLWNETDERVLASPDSAATWLEAAIRSCTPDARIIPRRLGKAGTMLVRLYSEARSELPE